MSLVKNIFYKTSSVLPMGMLKKLSPATTLLPYHHVVSGEYLPHIANLYSYKNPEQFNNDLDILLKHYDPIAPDDLVNYCLTHNRTPKGKFLVSFDDGFKEVYSIIAPILKARGLPAMFFINPAFIDNKALFYRNKISLLIDIIKKQGDNKSILASYAEILKLSNHTAAAIISKLKSLRSASGILDDLASVSDFSFDEWTTKYTPYLSLEQLRELNAQGFTIGAHSWDHPYYTGLKLQDQIKQTTDSCDFVEENKLSDKRYFSFPHYDAGLSQQLMDILKNETTAMFGTQNQKSEIYNHIYHRFNAERPEMEFSKQLKGLLVYMAVQKLLGKQQVARL